MDFKELYQQFVEICQQHGIKQKPELIRLFDCYCYHSNRYSSGAREMEGKSALDDTDLEGCKRIVNLLELLYDSTMVVVNNASKSKKPVELDDKMKDTMIDAFNELLLQIKPVWLQWILEERLEPIERFLDSRGVWKMILSEDKIRLSRNELKELRECIDNELNSKRIFKGMGKGIPYLGKIALEFSKAMMELSLKPTPKNTLIFDLMDASGCVKAFVKDGYDGEGNHEKYQKIEQWIDSYKSARKKASPQKDEVFFKFEDALYYEHLREQQKSEMEEVFKSGLKAT